MQTQLKMIILSSLMAALTSVGAFIRIPMIPVPFTMQTFFVILSGSLLGPFWGATSMIIYIFLGLIGLPVFAVGSGPGVILSPTFGYLVGFPIASYFVGKKVSLLMESPTEKLFNLRVWLYQTLGLILICILGVSYLYLVKRFYIGDNFTIPNAVLLGFIVFIPGILIKSFLASIVLVRMRNQLKIFNLKMPGHTAGKSPGKPV